jgi:phosphate transport system protein
VPRDEFRAELEALRSAVVALGETVVERLEQAIEAHESGDEALAREVVDGDAEINERYLAIESTCIDIFALQQPVASDLRFVAASFKISTDVERVADLATNLAEYAIETERELFPAVSVRDIAALASEMVADAVAAYGASDAAAATAVAERDDELDGLCGRVSQLVMRDLVVDHHTDDVEAVLPEVKRLLLTVRDLERVGDHAVNIAARTRYVVENDSTLLR